MGCSADLVDTEHCLVVVTSRPRKRISRGGRGYLVGAGLRLEIQPAKQILKARVRRGGVTPLPAAKFS